MYFSNFCNGPRPISGLLESESYPSDPIPKEPSSPNKNKLIHPYRNVMRFYLNIYNYKQTELTVNCDAASQNQAEGGD